MLSIEKTELDRLIEDKDGEFSKAINKEK